MVPIAFNKKQAAIGKKQAQKACCLIHVSYGSMAVAQQRLEARATRFKFTVVAYDKTGAILSINNGTETSSAGTLGTFENITKRANVKSSRTLVAGHGVARNVNSFMGVTPLHAIVVFYDRFLNGVEEIYQKNNRDLSTVFYTRYNMPLVSFFMVKVDKAVNYQKHHLKTLNIKTHPLKDLWEFEIEAELDSAPVACWQLLLPAYKYKVPKQHHCLSEFLVHGPIYHVIQIRNAVANWCPLDFKEANQVPVGVRLSRVVIIPNDFLIVHTRSNHELIQLPDCQDASGVYGDTMKNVLNDLKLKV